MITRTADSKGRVTLGEEFANQQVIIEQVDETEVRVTLAKIIPAREAWLYNNPPAKAAISAGLKAAAAHEFAEPPDLKADEITIRRREARR
jgi:hypothetical protein